MKRLAVIVIAVWLFFLQTGFCGDQGQYVEKMDNGSVNWSSNIVSAVGIGAPPEWSYGKPQARPMAITAARIVAYRNLMEVVKGIQLQSSTTVENFMLTDDTVRTQVNGMIQGARVTKTEYFEDGTVEVTVEMNLGGGFAQLMLPQDIKQVEPIKTQPPATGAAGTESGSLAQGFTGLVVDALGLGAKPAMSPRILDEGGQEVYGAAYVSRENAIQQGMCGYATELKSAMEDSRVAGNPLVVKGLRAEGEGRSDIVISNADAAKLRSSSENLSLLKQCRVMIAMN
ncbi:MAG: LPP20 family lipoprotein [Thermodesulfobacteriota bacterium]